MSANYLEVVDYVTYICVLISHFHLSAILMMLNWWHSVNGMKRKMLRLNPSDFSWRTKASHGKVWILQEYHRFSPGFLCFVYPMKEAKLAARNMIVEQRDGSCLEMNVVEIGIRVFIGEDYRWKYIQKDGMSLKGL